MRLKIQMECWNVGHVNKNEMECKRWRGVGYLNACFLIEGKKRCSQ